MYRSPVGRHRCQSSVGTRARTGKSVMCSRCLHHAILWMSRLQSDDYRLSKDRNRSVPINALGSGYLKLTKVGQHAQVPPAPNPNKHRSHTIRTVSWHRDSKRATPPHQNRQNQSAVRQPVERIWFRSPIGHGSPYTRYIRPCPRQGAFPLRSKPSRQAVPVALGSAPYPVPAHRALFESIPG
jgi:hypothetical protein